MNKSRAKSLSADGLPIFPEADSWERAWQKHWRKVGMPDYELPAGGPGSDERGEDHPFVLGWRWGEEKSSGATRSSTAADNV